MVMLTLAAYLAGDTFYKLHGSTDTGFIQGLYLVMLNRACNQTETQNWLQELTNNTGQRLATAEAFIAAAAAETK